MTDVADTTKRNQNCSKTARGPLAENFPPRCPKFVCQPKLFLNKLVLWGFSYSDTQIDSAFEMP